MIYLKVGMFLLSLFFSGMFLDDFVENIVFLAKERRMNLFPVGLFVATIACWSGFYFLTLL